MSETTIYHAGTIGGPDGQLSLSYMPEYRTVHLFATVPNDRRRAPIHIRLSDTALLREALERLEAAINDHAAKKRSPIPEDPNPVLVQGNVASIAVNGTFLSIDRTLYNEASALIAEGKSILAVALLSKRISWLGLQGAKELVSTIYESQRKAGTRE